MHWNGVCRQVVSMRGMQAFRVPEVHRVVGSKPRSDARSTLEQT
ncbi:unnamed protein product [Staurois parvus]|uniref:Uncharacterized protein n=1 Tax=Staurois parvus TaxID=386267 RepID=A0ABN9HDI4_9NEOB|nr:unnamed protein product [Staurois parvus]